jgi:GNAT superfamily N-acetyltransferase
MQFRRATVADIIGMSQVRMSVKENILTNPDKVTLESYREMLEEKGAGWVCVISETIVGFAIVDLSDANIWALFVAPGHDKKGIGLQLHNLMLSFSFEQGIKKLWLSTDRGTRADSFYHKAGWRQTELTLSGELRFEIDQKSYKLANTESKQSSF